MVRQALREADEFDGFGVVRRVDDLLALLHVGDLLFEAGGDVHGGDGVVVASAAVQQFDIDDVGARITGALEDALERGVTVFVLLTPELVDTLPETVGERYRDILQPHERCETRTVSNITSTFEIIDDTEVCIEVPHPLIEDETFAVIDLKDPEFATDVGAEFAPRWEEATELKL